MTAPWLRLDAAVFFDPKVRAAGPFASVVWVALLTICKASGGDGEVPEEASDGAYLAAYTGLPTDLAPQLESGLAGLVRVGLLTRVTVSNGDDDDGAERGIIAIQGWDRFQGDRTNAQRQARHRERVRRARNAVTARNGSNGDGTGQTLQTESPPTPPSGGGDLASPESPTAEATAPPAENLLRTVVYEVHGKDPRRWPYPSTWERGLELVSAERAQPDDWRDWLKAHRADGGEVAARGLVSFLAEKRKADARHRGAVAQGQAVVADALRDRANLLRGMDRARRDAWFRDAEARARDDGARKRLSDLRRIVEGAA